MVLFFTEALISSISIVHTALAAKEIDGSKVANKIAKYLNFVILNAPN
jgi:hypothetical protein